MCDYAHDLTIVILSKLAHSNNLYRPLASSRQLEWGYGNLEAIVRLWALSSELNGIAEADLTVYRAVGNPAVWNALASTSGNDAGSYSYTEATTPGFSAFLAGGPSAPTAITLQNQVVGPDGGSFNLAVLLVVGLLLAGTLLFIWVGRRRSAAQNG